MNINEVYTYEDLYEIILLLSNAYPLVISGDEETAEKLAKRFSDILEERKDQHIYSVMDDDTLVGCMRYFDFKMQLFSKKIPVGGIGMVAVDLLQKKKGIAKTIISDFLHHYRERGAVMATLYPFRPDFYKKMGFGFGKSLNQFKIPPSAFPKGKGKEAIHYLSKAEINDLLDCYHRYQEQTNGLFDKFPDEITGMMDAGQRFLGFWRDGRIEGYLSYNLEKTSDVNTMTQNMRIHQFVFENVEVLMAFSEFFRSQVDQVNRVIMNIQDQDFQYLFLDPRNDTNHNISPHFQECSVQGTGVMYRLINNVKFFELYKDHSFGGVDIKVSFDIEDDFYEDNNGRINISFDNGYPTVLDNSASCDVVVSMNVANFTSLVTGCVSFKSLLRYGQATLSDTSYTKKINSLFSAEDAPICMTRF